MDKALEIQIKEKEVTFVEEKNKGAEEEKKNFERKTYLLFTKVL